MSNSQSNPSNVTWECLAQSRNQAAVATLIGGLSSTDAELRNRSVAALANRKEKAAHPALIRNWHGFNDADTAVLRNDSSRLARAAADMLDTARLSEKRLALAVIADLRLTECVHSVLSVAQQRTHPLREEAVECLLVMCEQLGHEARLGSDSPRIRGPVRDAIHYQLGLFHEHKCTELIDAWLRIVHWDDVDHRRLLANPRHVAYRQIAMRLSASKAPAVLQLLAGYLIRSRTTPPHILSILAERADPKLAMHIAELLDDKSMAAALSSLRRLPPLACLEHIEDHLDGLSPERERRLWLLISASSDNLSLVLHGAHKLALEDAEESHVVAAAMIRGCRCPDMESLVAEIQTASTSLPGKISLGEQLIALADWCGLDNPVLQNAARHFYKEFSLDGLLDAVRIWPSQMCKAMAKIVKRVEVDYHSVLCRELQSPAHKRRLSALQVTQLMGVANHLSEQLLPLMDDLRLEVRVQAIDLLSSIGHPIIRQQLPTLMADANTDIQDAALRAQRRIQRRLAKSAQSQHAVSHR